MVRLGFGVSVDQSGNVWVEFQALDVVLLAENVAADVLKALAEEAGVTWYPDIVRNCEARGPTQNCGAGNSSC